MRSARKVSAGRRQSWNNQQVNEGLLPIEADRLARFHPDASPLDVAGAGALIALAQALLAGGEARHPGDASALLQIAQAHGVLEWLAWQACEAEMLQLEDSSAVGRLRDALRTATAAKLKGDAELQRLFAASGERGIGLLAIKGEALARMVYPVPACRPTADFDLWVEPGALHRMRDLLGVLGYTSWRGFHGEHIFAQQFFVRESGSGVRYQLDLHWDISNRRYFRKRLRWDALAVVDVPLPGGEFRAPSPPHALLIACVHLAAASPGEALQLKWLLDIRLLLDRIGAADMRRLVEDAGRWGLLAPLAVYAPMAEAVLGESAHAEVLRGLPRPDAAERARYRRCCDQRWYDLREYAGRLGSVAERFRLLGEVLRYRLGR